MFGGHSPLQEKQLDCKGVILDVGQVKSTQATLRVLVSLLALSPLANALVINGENAPDNYRFSSGYPLTPVPNNSSSFVAAGFDLSGVGWGTDAKRSYTMISDRYFVFATHYPPTDNDMYFFSPTNGRVHYSIDSAFSLTLEYPFASPGNHLMTDLSVGRLTTAINAADNITSYPILNLSPANYVGLNLLVYGWDAAVGTGVIGELGQGNLYWDNNTPANAADDILKTDTNFDNLNDTYVMTFTQGAGAGEALLQGGDSGSPTFVPWNGSLALVGTHSAVNGSTSYDTFLPAYMQSLDNQGIPFNTVPEPSSCFLIFAGLGGVAFARRKFGVR
ncbi:MAG: PEP-CTERM sorting domain-containing protein [Terrimicrobiaceae bacterium]